MNRNDLRIRASREAADLGPEPRDASERSLWDAKRQRAAMLLSEIADRNSDLLRRAATGEWVEIAARDLLLDAAQECR